MNFSYAIETEDLRLGYHSGIVAEGVSFVIQKGEVVALLGRNGCGKSTLLRTLSGSLKSKGGTIRIKGHNLQDISPRDMARLIAVVVTDKGSETYLTVRETVELGRQPYTGFLGRMNDIDRQIIDNSMRYTGCFHLADRGIDTLSDGERQKVSIARALAQDTSVLLLDEPFSFIDVASRLELLMLLKKIACESDKAIVFSTHDVAQAFRYADRLLCFTIDGQVVCGTSAEMIESGVPERLFDVKDIIFDPAIMDYSLKYGKN